jgi:rhodanese-related sulfurtransferase
VSPRYRQASLAIAALLVSLVFAGCSREPAPSATGLDLKATIGRYLSGLPDGWNEIEPVALAEEMKTARPFLLDVRETREIDEAGYIAGTVSVPVRGLIKNLNRLPAKDQPVVVVCSSGHRSAMVMAALQLLGYTNVKSLVGGLPAWKAAGLPLSTGTPPEAKAGSTPDANPDLVAALDRYFDALPNGWRLVAPLTVKDLTASSQPFQLDLREPAEIAAGGRIDGSTSIPIRTLFDHLDQLPPDKGALIIVECTDGHRSAVAMLALGLLRYNYVRSIALGLNEWTREGLPLTRS